MRDMTLGELLAETGGSVKTGPFGTTLKAAEYSTSGPPVISVGEVGYGYLRLHERTPRVPQAVIERLPEYVLRSGDIVFGRKGAVDRSAWLRDHEDGYFLGSDGIRVRVGQSADSRFIAYQLQSQHLRDWLIQHAAGTTMASLNQPTLERVPLMIPALPQQRGIADVLGALDDKIAANTGLISSAEELMATQAALATNTTPVATLASHSTRSARPEDFDEMVAHYSLPAFDVAARPEIAVRTSIKSNKFVVDRPSVLMSKLNPRIPRIWNVPVLPGRMALSSTEFVVLQPIDVEPSVLWAALSHPEVSATLTGKVAGTSGSHQRVKPAELMSLEIPDPRSLPVRVQESIGTAGLVVDARRRENASLEEMRDALLPQLMSGKIRVKDAERVVEGVV